MPTREPSGNEAETVIAASVKVEGEFVSQGNVLIEGVVEGSLRTERNLRVGEKAVISADVSAASASVAGEVNGNIEISERLELEPTARIHGDIRTKSLIVASGATINGRIAMGALAEQEGKDGRKAGQPQDNKSRSNGAKEKEGSPETEKAEDKVVNALFGR